MLGVPIGSRLATLAIPAMLALVALAAGPVMAQTTGQPSVETLMHYMLKDHAVTKPRKTYRPAVQAAMLYTQCPEEYAVNEDKKVRYNTELANEDRKLRNGFNTAHQTLTGKLPGSAVLKAVDDYIKKLQHDEALQIGLLLKSHKKGCKQAAMVNLDKYYEDKYAYELQQQAAAAAAEEKRRMEVPAVNESQETENN